MVTAGIFMVARMSPLYELSEVALSLILLVGALTAFFMGLLGLVQHDIKRVIAYSTLSQLGYMTVALGVSAYSVAIFHLVTHAFFKALLFLAAGSVIIALHHEQDLRKMGGLVPIYADNMVYRADWFSRTGRFSADIRVFSRRMPLLRRCIIHNSRVRVSPTWPCYPAFLLRRCIHSGYFF